MPAEPAVLVDELEIVRHVGPAAFSRARAYRSAVRAVRSAGGTVSATVQGGEPAPYQVRIELAPARGRWQVRRSACSCPVGEACKHVAATLLVLRDRAELQTRRPPAADDWRAVLAALSEPEGRAPARRAELALQFELRSRARRPGRGSARDTTADAGASVDRLAARPMTLGARGAWIKGGLSWQNIAYQSSYNYDAGQLRWFAQLALLQSSRQIGFIAYGSDWLTVDDFESPLLWAHLAEAGRLGITLTATGSFALEIGHAAEIGYAVAADAGGLELAPSAGIDGSPWPIQAVRPIGRHGVYAWDADRRTIVLAPVPGGMSAEQRAILGAGATVRIPAEDASAFFAETYPRLGRAVRLASADESVELPPLPEPELVLTARHEPGHVLRLDRAWSVDPPAHARAVEAAVEAVLAADPAGRTALSGGAPRSLVPSTTLRDLDAAEFAARLLGRLAAIEGVRVDETGQRPDYRELTAAPHLAVSLVETRGNDWFDLGVMVTVEGNAIPFDPLFRALSTGRRKLLLVDGSYLSLDQPVFEPLKRLIEEAGTLSEWEAGRTRVSRHQVSLWEDFEDLADSSDAAVSWRESVAGLRAGAQIEPVPAPEGFTGELRPYQLDGLSWLAFLQRHGLGGILADDMGLGKTAQTLALVAHARTDRPFLVVAPTSVVSNWAAEAARFTPGLRVATITATEARSADAVADVAAASDIVVTSYAIMRIDAARFQALEWGGVVFDEAQFIKNRTAKAHEAARGLQAPFRLAVTGTPIENNLGELWALLQVVAPGLFPSRRRFDEHYRRPIENDGSTERLAQLRRRIRPFLLRRTKELVASDLPAKQEQTLTVELASRHRRVYDGYLQRERQKLLGLVEDLDRNRFIVFRSLTLLRMLALDATLIDAEAYAGVASAKLDVLFEQLDDVLAEGHKALVFSQFTSFLTRAAERLDAAGVGYAYLDGATRRRAQVVGRFRSGEASVFLISLKAGGFGLNLTEADYVFLLDPWWNPATEAQAIDRTHRIGQTRPVMVYRLVAADTIEEKVMALKARKGELVSAVLDDDAPFGQRLTADDIRELLA